MTNQMENGLKTVEAFLMKAMDHDELNEHEKALSYYREGLNLTNTLLKPISETISPTDNAIIIQKLRKYRDMNKTRIQALTQTRSNNQTEQTWGQMLSSTVSNWLGQSPTITSNYQQAQKTQKAWIQSATPNTTTEKTATIEQQPHYKHHYKQQAMKKTVKKTRPKPPSRQKTKQTRTHEHQQNIHKIQEHQNNNKRVRRTRTEILNLPSIKRIDKTILTTMMGTIVSSKSSTTFNDIVGLEDVKQLLSEMIIWPALRPDLFQGLLSPPRGVLLYGPPGTGKTMIAQATANSCDATFFSVSASSLTSKFHGEGEKMVQALFALARACSPSIIFVDELDALLSKRSENEHEASRRLKTEFFVQMQGLHVDDHSTDSVIVMGATNLPNELDSAALRRFERRVYIPLPDAAARRALMESLLPASHQLGSSWSALEKLTVGYSCADLKQLCTEAAFYPLRDNKTPISNLRTTDLRPISLYDFERAAQSVRPSTTSADLVLFEQWHQSFASKK